jgi:hypothetical protein
MSDVTTTLDGIASIEFHTQLEDENATDGNEIYQHIFTFMDEDDFVQLTVIANGNRGVGELEDVQPDADTVLTHASRMLLAMPDLANDQREAAIAYLNDCFESVRVQQVFNREAAKAATDGMTRQ